MEDRGTASGQGGSSVKDGEEICITSGTGQRTNEVNMDVGEPSSWNRYLRNSSMNMNTLMNLTPVALKAVSGPGVDISRESSPHKGCRDQPQGRTNTRVQKVM